MSLALTGNRKGMATKTLHQLPLMDCTFNFFSFTVIPSVCEGCGGMIWTGRVDGETWKSGRETECLCVCVCVQGLVLVRNK